MFPPGVVAGELQMPPPAGGPLAKNLKAGSSEPSESFTENNWPTVIGESGTRAATPTYASSCAIAGDEYPIFEGPLVGAITADFQMHCPVRASRAHSLPSPPFELGRGALGVPQASGGLGATVGGYCHPTFPWLVPRACTA